jgi:predicted amidophosphoribosyltransferase
MNNTNNFQKLDLHEGDAPDYRHTFIIPYRNPANKDLICKIKLMDPPSLGRGAELLHTYICNAAVVGSHMRILLLHAPSSAYAKGERKEDQVLHMLRRIARMHSKMPLMATVRNIHEHGVMPLRIDILPHFFILNHDKRNPQHEADRQTRITNAKAKFRIFHKAPGFFIKTFDLIYIIDDVSTTGHTLHALASLICAAYPEIADRVRTVSIAH